MNDAPRTFQCVDDQFLARQIHQATRRVILVAPAIGDMTAKALEAAMRDETLSVDVVLDASPDSVRLGYGDVEALELLNKTAAATNRQLRNEPGVRIGLLVVDDVVAIWSPTPRSIEERAADEANGLVLAGPVVETCAVATGHQSHPGHVPTPEIGRRPLPPQVITDTLKELRINPPAPFDLARRTRVFSSRFQFVELEIRGAEWTERRMKLSSLVLNADLPESLRDLMETQIRPFQEKGDVAFPVPHLVHGRRAFDENGKRMIVPATQGELMKAWSDTRDRYLYHVKGFGWIIRRDTLAAFRKDIEAFEETLLAWVDQFRAAVLKEEGALVTKIVKAVQGRVERSEQRKALERLDLEREVRGGLQRMRVIEPRVRVVLKDVAWESSRDSEFLSALAAVLGEEKQSDWFEEFIAAPARKPPHAET